LALDFTAWWERSFLEYPFHVHGSIVNGPLMNHTHTTMAREEIKIYINHVAWKADSLPSVQ